MPLKHLDYPNDCSKILVMFFVQILALGNVESPTIMNK